MRETKLTPKEQEKVNGIVAYMNAFAVDVEHGKFIVKTNYEKAHKMDTTTTLMLEKIRTVENDPCLNQRGPGTWEVNYIPGSPEVVLYAKEAYLMLRQQQREYARKGYAKRMAKKKLHKENGKPYKADEAPVLTPLEEKRLDERKDGEVDTLDLEGGRVAKTPSELSEKGKGWNLVDMPDTDEGSKEWLANVQKKLAEEVIQTIKKKIILDIEVELRVTVK